jgi:hypothetical protein
MKISNLAKKSAVERFIDTFPEIKVQHFGKN